MDRLVPKNAPTADSEQRERSLQTLLLTLVLTPVLVFPEPVRNISELEATVAAVTLGLVAGIVVSFILGRVQFQVENDVRTTVVAFASAVVATILLWVVLPAEFLQTAPQFCLAFIWAFSLTEVTRDVLWPKLASVQT